MNTTGKIKKIKLILTYSCFAIFACYVLSTSININASKANIDNNSANNRTLPTTVVLDDPELPNSAFAGDKGKTPFDHNQHISERANISCVTCHHTNSKNLTEKLEEDVSKCAVCHQADDTTCTIEGTNEDNKFKGKLALNSKDAYHGEGEKDNAGCISCHKNRNIEPMGCSSCHTGKTTVEYLIQPLFPTIGSKTKTNKTNINVTQNNYTIKSYPDNYPNNNWYYPQSNDHYYRYGYSSNYPNHNPWGNLNNTNLSNHLEVNLPESNRRESANTNTSVNSPVINYPQPTNYPEPILKPISNVYLSLENEKPDKKEVKIDNSFDNSLEEKNPPKELVSDLPANLTTNVSPSISLIDELLPWVNKVIIVVIIFLYLDIRRRLNN